MTNPNHKLPPAETLPYWQSGQSAPDTWIEKVKQEIQRAKGQVLASGFGEEAVTGRSAYMLAFRVGEDTYKILWPVLPARSGQESAARRQAATMLYHDVKSRCVAARVFGARHAFFSYLLLPDGTHLSDKANPELQHALPQLLSDARPALPPPRSNA